MINTPDRLARARFDQPDPETIDLARSSHLDTTAHAGTARPGLDVVWLPARGRT